MKQYIIKSTAEQYREKTFLTNISHFCLLHIWTKYDIVFSYNQLITFIMKNLTLPSELMAYMTESGKFVFIDDFSGWGEETQVAHFEFAPVIEGNSLIAENGDRFNLQYVSMRRGNHLTVQLRDNNEDTCQELKLADLPLFQDFNVIIWTSNEALRGFAPLCNSKLELALFLQNLADYGDPKDYALDRIKSDMAALAIFLYRNNPEKTTSILDELE